MTAIAISPRDPLVVRDGRPNLGRSESGTLPFPHPATVAGMCRTWLGSAPGRGFILPLSRLEDLKKVAIRGPLLVSPSESGSLSTVYVPSPRDAVFATTETGRLTVRPLHPLAREGVLYDGDLPEDLAPVGLTASESIPGKAPRELPAFWALDELKAWLEGVPVDSFDSFASRVKSHGTAPLPHEARMHVALDSRRGTAEDGALFQVTGLRFLGSTAKKGDEEEKERLSLSLLVEVDASPLPDLPLWEGLLPVGGEKRLASFSIVKDGVFSSVGQGGTVRKQLEGEAPEGVTVRVILLTPAWFQGGSLPGPGLSPLLPSNGIARLVAALVPRPETVSGWDMERGRPKGTRRLVGAGSVYWLHLQGTPAQRLDWWEGVWMQNVSDSAPARADGYGLAVVGVGR